MKPQFISTELVRACEKVPALIRVPAVISAFLTVLIYALNILSQRDLHYRDFENTAIDRIFEGISSSNQWDQDSNENDYQLFSTFLYKQMSEWDINEESEIGITELMNLEGSRISIIYGNGQISQTNPYFSLTVFDGGKFIFNRSPSDSVSEVFTIYDANENDPNVSLRQYSNERIQELVIYLNQLATRVPSSMEVVNQRSISRIIDGIEYTAIVARKYNINEATQSASESYAIRLLLVHSGSTMPLFLTDFEELGNLRLRVENVLDGLEQSVKQNLTSMLIDLGVAPPADL